MFRSKTCVILFIAFVPIWSQNVQTGDSTIECISCRSPRFGFSFLNDIRKEFCEEYCRASDNSPYLYNLVCTFKCPELYLPMQEITTATTSPLIVSSSSTQSHLYVVASTTTPAITSTNTSVTESTTISTSTSTSASASASASASTSASTSTPASTTATATTTTPAPVAPIFSTNTTNATQPAAPSG